MKKILTVLMSVAFILVMFPISASAASGSLSGPSTVRAGDTISVTFRVSGGNFYGYTGTLDYDSSVVTLQSVSSNTGSSWAFSRDGNTLVAYETSGYNNPASSVFTAQFKVSNGVSTGTKLSIGFTGSFKSETNEQTASGTYAATIAAPLSSDATLSSLLVANANLSPAFSPNTTSYSCGTVGFEISKLSVSARANATGAKVSVSGSSLSVGKNTVSIVVTAPSGAKKTYTITVTREQDPNYVASTNTKLSGITLSTGQLSPQFTSDTKAYVVYVPFETTTLSITGAAADPLAQGVENVTDAKLEVGLNELSIKCTAEDGTEGVYKFYVVRFNEFGGVDTVALPIDTEGETEVTEPVSSAEEEQSAAGGGVSPVLLGVLSGACLLLGIAIGVLILRGKYNKLAASLEVGASSQVGGIDPEAEFDNYLNDASGDLDDTDSFDS